MDKLIEYPDGTDQPGVEFEVANGFVARVVGDIAERNIPDAEKVAAILNNYFSHTIQFEDDPPASK
jgi:hypothetical protein